MENPKKILKKRNWAFVLYPESAPLDWKEQLEKTGIQGCISPLHDKDINPTGEAKKAHYHIILCYSGPTSFTVVQNLTKSLNQPNPQALEQLKGYYRYLTHIDNPEKAQYKSEEIQNINGFSVRDFIEISKSEITQIKKDLIEKIIQNGIVEYSDFINFVLNNLDSNFQDIATQNTLFFNSYLKSLRHKICK